MCAVTFVHRGSKTAIIDFFKENINILKQTIKLNHIMMTTILE